MSDKTIELTYYDEHSEIYVYTDKEMWFKHRMYMTTVRKYVIEAEDIVGNDEGVKVEYRRY